MSGPGQAHAARRGAQSIRNNARWTPLPRGEFTGVDWRAPGAIDGQDPYLAWAEADRFAGYRIKPGGKPPKWLPIVIELTPGASVPALVTASSIKWLQIPRVYLNLPELRFCTAHVKPRFFKTLRSDPLLRGMVQRFELGLPVGHHTQPIHDPCTPGCLPVHAADRLSGKVLGLIDGGLAFANQAFLNAQGGTRVKHFWRQDGTQDGDWPGNEAHNRGPLDPTRAGPRPRDMGYWHELSGATIDAAMATYTHGGRLDEEALYQHLQLRDLCRPTDHGTHVMSLAAGRGNLLHPGDDDASRCDLIAVQFDVANVRDTSGGAMNVSVLDALMYILARCTPQAQLVVNISWGTLAGPHDGSSILEAAMDQLIELCAGRLQVTAPGGNGYQSRTHANDTLAPGVSSRLQWRVQPDDRTQSFLEIWIPCGAEGMAISVTPPGQAHALPPLHKGQSGLWVNADGLPMCGLIFPNDSALGAGSTCALLALAPTFSHNPKAVTAPFGSWQVTLTNTGAAAVVFDVYVERDDVSLGQNTGARQSYFEDAWYDTSGNIGSFVDHPDNPTPIRRSGTFNSLSTGRNTVSVGGTRREASPSAHFARYSPLKPDPDASRPQRVGVKKVPDTLAATDDNPALWGVLGAGSLSGSVARLAGTSSAAPQEARRLINRP